MLWVKAHRETTGLKLGYFGASTGAAIAPESAAEFGNEIKAIVSRGGRPDLTEDALGKVVAPTLLIVRGRDDVVISLNKKALDVIKGLKGCRSWNEGMHHTVTCYAGDGIKKEESLSGSALVFLL
ncbi:MAG TPA: hypothetical protein DCP92_01195 [Nitrospiraceae bacterium]|nr:hypothetical protein [Nitrospiraceae bacterium]